MRERPPPPNVLFLFSDQHNARCLSCAGHPDVKTPNLDRLSAEGVRFENAYTQNPICTPSRMSFLSGLYPSTMGTTASTAPTGPRDHEHVRVVCVSGLPHRSPRKAAHATLLD